MKCLVEITPCELKLRALRGSPEKSDGIKQDGGSFEASTVAVPGGASGASGASGQ